jgi:hypothetical protein
VAPRGEVRWFGVRHHSPAAARLVRDLIARERPAAVLIEGPSDFDDRMDELALDHRLPIAIYSSVILEDRGRAAAYHPFCVHSPEWQALRAARAIGATVRFIDLPWAALAAGAEAAHRYGDHELRRAPGLPAICERLGVEDFDAAWDRLVEVDPELGLDDYVRRCEAICMQLRGSDEDAVPASDRRREAFMAARIQAALAEHDGCVLVVCGGFHVPGLRRLLASGEPLQAEQPPARAPGDGRVVALTPYSFAALDALTGYEAGMPNPGFYDAVWAVRGEGSTRAPVARVVLERIVARLRERGVDVSPADLIAVGTTAGALAALRGHAEIWRSDLLDGILGALVKDELEAGIVHPMLAAAHEVLRGGARGQLATGVSRPPLVGELERALDDAGLRPGGPPRTVDLDLAHGDLDRSRLLHRIAVLDIPGFEALDVAGAPRSAQLRERWRVSDHPSYDGAAIEAAGYGPTVAEAAAARLLERLAGVERDAATAAAVLMDVALCGLDEVARPLLQRTRALVAGDPSLASVAGALRTALHLYRYEPVLGTAGAGAYGELVVESYSRVLWLTDPGGGVAAPEDAGVEAIAVALECHERCGGMLDLAREELVAVLDRVRCDSAAAPAVRGAALGAVWQLDGAGDDELAAAPAQFADPAQLGDFLHGLFALAREPVQRRAALVGRIDDVVSGFADDEFLDAAPALRRAFSIFTPREKDNLARTLLGATGAAAARAPGTEPETLAAMLALEGRLRGALDAYGIRGRER